MSRYIFIAAAMLFSSLLVIFAIAVAQRDARINSTPVAIDHPPYEYQAALPIVVPSQFIGPDGGFVEAASSEGAWGTTMEGPPPPIVRSNDRGKPSTVKTSTQYEPLSVEAEAVAFATPDSHQSEAVELASYAPSPQEPGSNLRNLPSTTPAQSPASSSGASPRPLSEPTPFGASKFLKPRSASTEQAPALLNHAARTTPPVEPPSMPAQRSATEPGVPSAIESRSDSSLPSSPGLERAAPPTALPSASLPSVIGLPDLAPMAATLPAVPSSLPAVPSAIEQAMPSVSQPLAGASPEQSPNSSSRSGSDSSRASTAPTPQEGIPSNPSNGFPNAPRPVASLGAPLPENPLPVAAPALDRDPPSIRRSIEGANAPSPLGNAEGSMERSNAPIPAPPTGLPSGFTNPTNAPHSNAPNASTNPVPGSRNASGLNGTEPRGGHWSLASGAPGNRQFDGSQNPSLEIQKRAPLEVQVGVPATFTAIVRNVGNSTAFDVQVTDAIPKGSRLVRTLPVAERVGADGLLWKLGELAAGQESTISMELIPESEGEIGSVASIKFEAQASVRTISTQPRIAVKQSAPPEMLGGDSTVITIEVSNTGTGTARDVQLEEDVPSLFRHSTGAKALLHPVGDLAPGETQRFEIELMAVGAGKANNIVRATATNSATSESVFPIEIRAPKLQLHLVGPKLRHLERPAPYEAVIENLGTAVAKNIYIVARLPRGMNFISATNEGTYQPDEHSVVWNLEELAAGTRAKTEVTLLPVEEGRFVVLMSADAEGVRADPIEREVNVEGQSELTFNIDDDNDPIENQEVTTYTVQITNIGTRPDTDIQLAIELPEGALLEQVSGPLQYQANGRSVVFAPLAKLQAKEQITVKVAVRHQRQGTQILRASLKSALRAVPVVKDESTQVYIDR